MNSGQPILGVKKNPTSRPLLLYRKDNQFYSDINQNIWRDVAHWTLARKRSVCASVIICWDILVWSILKNNIWFEEWKLWRKCCSGQYYWGKKVCVFFWSEFTWKIYQEIYIGYVGVGNTWTMQLQGLINTLITDQTYKLFLYLAVWTNWLTTNVRLTVYR